MLKLEHYRHCIFDFDGVLADTNGIKAANIRRAAVEHCDDAAKIDEFVEHFTAGFGIPREKKINRYFPGETGRTILARYNRLNLDAVAEMALAPGAEEFLDLIASKGVSAYIVSGSDPSEIHPILKFNDVVDRFVAVRGGPKSKTENIEELGIDGAAFFIGDSRADHETARHFGFDFVFLYRYTIFTGWESYFAEFPDVPIAADFTELMNSISR